MRHHLRKSPALPPPAGGIPGRLSFEGMQDRRLIITPTDPVWDRLADERQRADDAAELEIDLATISPIELGDHPEGQMVIDALSRLGVID